MLFLIKSLFVNVYNSNFIQLRWKSNNNAVKQSIILINKLSLISNLFIID